MMNKRAWTGTLLALGLAVMSRNDLVRAEAPSVGRHARFTYSVLTTGEADPQGVMGDGVTHPTGSVSFDLEPDQSQRWNMRVRLGPVRPGSPCGSKVTVSMAPQTLDDSEPSPLSWGVGATLRSVATDRIEASYSWERRERGLAPTATGATGEGAVVLREDDRVLLDFVPLDRMDPARPCFRNVALELSAAVAEDRARTEQRLAYDLWLVSDDRGTQTKRHLRLIGKQGEKVAYDYGGLRSKAGSPSAGAPSTERTTSVRGQIRGRLEGDGAIDLAFFAEREILGEAWAVQSHGEKRVRAAAGETLRLELPPPVNLASLDASSVDAIAQHRVSLILTVTRVE